MPLEEPMKTRRDRQGDLLEVRAFYSVPALAQIANVSADMMRRLLRTNRLELLRVGRVLLVPLSEIRKKVPPLWDSLRAAEELRQARPCPRCGWIPPDRPARYPSSRASRARTAQG